MAQRGISILKGIEAQRVIDLFNKAYCDEWLAYYQYFSEARVIKGLMKDAVVAELNLHGADELRHATLISNRIIQLGGTPILHPSQWLSHSNCGYDAPTNFDVRAILDQAVKGEQCAISTYSSLLDHFRDKDIVTYDLVSQILADEVEHEEDLQSLFDDIEDFITQFKS